MTIVTITYKHDDPTNADISTYGFEHMMVHRNYFVAMAPLSRFSVLPYLLEPFPYPALRASDNWNLNHQQGHDDALTNLPSYYESDQRHAGLFIGQNLRDTDFANEEQVQWWTFANHMEHYIANNAIFPETIAPPSWRWPFW